MHRLPLLGVASIVLFFISSVCSFPSPQDAPITSSATGSCAIVQNVTDAPDTVNCFPPEQGTPGCTLNADFFEDGTNYFEVQDFNCTRHGNSGGCITTALPSQGITISPPFSMKRVTILDIPRPDPSGRYNPADGFKFSFTGSNPIQIRYIDTLDFEKNSNSKHGAWMDFDGQQENRINQRNVDCLYKSSRGDMNGSYIPGKCYIVEFLCAKGSL